MLALVKVLLTCVELPQVKETKAVYRVRDPAEVRVFLDKLVQWGKGEANAWHGSGACKGWNLNLEGLTAQNGTTSGAHADESKFASRFQNHPPETLSLDCMLPSVSLAGGLDVGELCPFFPMTSLEVLVQSLGCRCCN